ETARARLRELEPHLRDSRAWQELEGQLAPDAYWRQKTWKRVVVIAAGPATNVLLAIVLFAGLYMVGTSKATRKVERVLPSRPAATAGLKPGDVILAVDGHRVKATDIARRINATHGRPFTIVVRRGRGRVTIGPLRAQDDHGIYRVGFQIRGVPGPGESPPRAVWSALKAVGYVTADTARRIVHHVTGRDPNQISSGVGMSRLSSRGSRPSLMEPLPPAPETVPLLAGVAGAVIAHYAGTHAWIGALLGLAAGFGLYELMRRAPQRGVRRLAILPWEFNVRGQRHRRRGDLEAAAC